ncbi:MAG: hypothetical protein CL681_27130 [Blastopirellula sp.]|nr:hypothetical protein [Blastopirellula sp.]
MMTQLSLLVVAIVTADVSFTKDVRPILAAHCFACHGPDAAQREAALRLDVEREAKRLLDSGQRAVVPGDVAASQLLQRVNSHDPGMVMPPPEAKKPLSAAQREILKAWIERGAPYDQHWAFQQPKRPALPEHGNAADNEIDRLVVARMQLQDLQLSEPADRITLLRRLSFDLRGLPPTLAEVDAFTQDRRADAYERLVDRMLGSQHYGERMAQDWLDLARYGDTNGYHADSDRDMWLYRDYVIRAFNQNKPFNEFIIENVAGDLLPKSTIETRIASGFNRCSTFNEEGGADPDEFYVAYAIDRANTTGQVFLGLTVGCAQCHDHKYDPISQREYYQLYAFFNSVEGEIGAGGPSGYHGKPLPPLLNVETDEYRYELQRLEHAVAIAERARQAELTQYRQPSDAFLAALKTWEQSIRVPAQATLPVKKGLVAWLAADDVNGDGQADAAQGKQPPEQIAEWRDKSGKGHHATATGKPRWRADSFGKLPGIELDGTRDFLRTASGGEQLAGDFTMVLAFQQKELRDNQMLLMWGDEANGKRRAMWKIVGSNKLSFNGYNADVVGTQVMNLAKSQIAMLSKQGDTHQIQFHLDGAEGGSGTAKLVPYENQAITIGANNAGNEKTAAVYAEVLIYDRALDDDEQQQVGRYLAGKYEVESTYGAVPEKIRSILAQRVEQRDETATALLREYFARHGYPESRQKLVALEKQVKDAQQQLAAMRKQLPTTMVMVEKKKRNKAYVLMRGDFQQPRDEVQPDVPAIFPRLPTDQPRNRLALAHWLCDPQHPLVARVAVNRIWKQLFGVGIVKTLGDFGTQGALPSHPELLDWLAVEFVESGWDVKALQKRIVMSRTYRQSSLHTDRDQQIDPNNRMLARSPRFRISAEEIRDTALFISGLLNRQVGGPSVKPYQPTGYYSDKVGRGWNQSKGGSLYRRGLYTYWRRTTLYPTFQIFDASSREVCTVNRPRTNTPLQALVLMNDPTYVEAARVFAEKILLSAAETDEQRLRFAFRSAVSRQPTDQELQLLQATLRDERQAFGADLEAAQALAKQGEALVAEGLEPRELAAWTALASVLLNLDETITRE